MTRKLVSDAFGLPRDPDNAIHGKVGEWEYAAVTDVRTYIQKLMAGWKVVGACGDHLTMKYTHWERCGCGKEVGHD